MIWMHELARVRVKATIIFYIGREQMVKTTIHLFENPHQRLLTEIIKTPIANKIERILKGLKFSFFQPHSRNLTWIFFHQSEFFVSGRGRSSLRSRGRGYCEWGGKIMHIFNPNLEISSLGRVTGMWASLTVVIGIYGEEKVGVASCTRSGTNMHLAKQCNSCTIDTFSPFKIRVFALEWRYKNFI